MYYLRPLCNKMAAGDTLDIKNFRRRQPRDLAPNFVILARAGTACIFCDCPNAAVSRMARSKPRRPRSESERSFVHAGVCEAGRRGLRSSSRLSCRRGHMRRRARSPPPLAGTSTLTVPAFLKKKKKRLLR